MFRLKSQNIYKQTMFIRSDILTYSYWIDIEEKIKKVQDSERFHHTIGVMYTAAALAMAYGEDTERARLAGLLHDCAKCVPNGEKADICMKCGLSVSDFERNNPAILHGKLGAYYARHKYNVDDDEICSAIRYHTTGKPNMTVLEKIVFIADYIEPDRDEMPRLGEIRQMAFTDMNKCTAMIMSDTLTHLKESNRAIDDETVRAYEYYKIYEKRV